MTSEVQHPFYPILPATHVTVPSVTGEEGTSPWESGMFRLEVKELIVLPAFSTAGDRTQDPTPANPVAVLLKTS
jgi:hypothetical protein